MYDEILKKNLEKAHSGRKPRAQVSVPWSSLVHCTIKEAFFFTESKTLMRPLKATARAQ